MCWHFKKCAIIQVLEEFAFIAHPRRLGNVFLLGESVAVVPLLTSEASAPLASTPLPAPAALVSFISRPQRFGDVVTTTNVGIVTQGQGFQNTRCYTSAVRSIAWHFASEESRGGYRAGFTLSRFYTPS